jgi:catechol 2,3-dioxygenase-like lactoylglutathione lyase family enzyme
VLSHLSLGVKNLERSKRFYDAILAPLGFEMVWKTEKAVGYGPPGGLDRLALFEEQEEVRLCAGPGFHLAFEAPHRDAVHLFYAAALEIGGICDGKPGPRPQYSETYYAAFILDPDGHKLEAVHQ